MRKLSTKKAVAVIGVAALATTGTGVAYAYWTTSGTGTGSATTAAGQATGFSVAGNVANAMYPGDSSQTGTATVTNLSATQSAYLTKVVAWITTDKAGCTGADYLLNGSSTATAAAPTDLGFTAVDIAKAGTATKDFTLQFNNTGANQNACKSAAVTINYSAS